MPPLLSSARWQPGAGGSEVAFADVQIVIESSNTAHAFVSVEVTTPDPQGQPSMDSRDASVSLSRQGDREWVITKAEAKGLPTDCSNR